MIKAFPPDKYPGILVPPPFGTRFDVREAIAAMRAEAVASYVAQASGGLLRSRQRAFRRGVVGGLLAGLVLGLAGGGLTWWLYTLQQPGQVQAARVVPARPATEVAAQAAPPAIVAAQPAAAPNSPPAAAPVSPSDTNSDANSGANSSAIAADVPRPSQANPSPPAHTLAKAPTARSGEVAMAGGGRRVAASRVGGAAAPVSVERHEPALARGIPARRPAAVATVATASHRVPMPGTGRTAAEAASWRPVMVAYVPPGQAGSSGTTFALKQHAPLLGD